MEDLNIKETYVDGIGKIHFVGGMIRLDLYSFDPNTVTNENDKPIPCIAQRIIMSPNGFLSSYEAMINMLEKLEKAGILQKRLEE